MPGVRYKAFRTRVGHSLKRTTDSEKLRILRALFIVTYNEDKSLYPMSLEIFHTLGSILEGAQAADIELHQIDKKAFLATYADLRSRFPNAESSGAAGAAGAAVVSKAANNTVTDTDTDTNAPKGLYLDQFETGELDAQDELP